MESEQTEAVPTPEVQETEPVVETPAQTEAAPVVTEEPAAPVEEAPAETEAPVTAEPAAPESAPADFTDAA